jgi:putative transferase (TIGR04331 family)
LLVATYNATTYLETFSANYPTLLFWDFKFWELNDQAKPYFKNLYEAGILHYSPESLVNKLEEVYKDPMSWWMQKEVQLAKDEFCSKFANIGHGDFVKQWQNELREL